MLYLGEIDALVTAAYVGHFDVVSSLIERGVDPNVTDENSNTALILATSESYEDIVRFLLDNGADVNSKDGDGDTALDIARYYGYENMIDLLTSRGGKGTDGPCAKARRMDAYYGACEQANLTKLTDNSASRR